ncbi:MAG: hypothetical protein JW995_09535 [Melioribacteraceae bacterium]|nr:hypothetical protein [Melioribacteraceae bacterium]
MNEVYQYIGYAGSALIALSLMMKNILRLRTINLFGAATFATYGYLVGAYPVLLLNGFITLVDIYYLSGILREKEHFGLMPVLDESHPYLNKFIDFYSADINKFFPGFNIRSVKNPSCFFILRNLKPAGLFIFEQQENNTAYIHLDYAIPDYRDFKNAKFVYSAEQKYLKENGVSNLRTRSKVERHVNYLIKLGFIKAEEEAGLYVKNI